MKLSNVEDLYPLSPMQQGMLFHTLAAPTSAVYFNQLRCVLRGPLDTSEFKRAWQQVVDRESVLRTAFLWQGLDEPLQVVRQRVPLGWDEQDWRDAPTGQPERLAAFLRADRAQRFELSRAPLMRFALLRVGDDAYQFIWSHHHLLLDGWSLPLVLEDVFTLYEASRSGRGVHLKDRRPYRDYIAWLHEQDLFAAERFWRAYLGDVGAPASLLGAGTIAGCSTETDGYEQQEIGLDAASTARLQALGRRHRLTLNTFIVGAWALLLRHYTAQEDIVFGATVAGRPAALAGVESMIGLFINTLPVRVRVAGEDWLLQWLQKLQVQLLEVQRYDYTPLVRIQGWSGRPRGLPLFETIVVFENYPAGSPVRGTSVQFSDLSSVERVNYPLTLIAGLVPTLSLRLAYETGRFEAAAIGRMLAHLRTLLEGVATDPVRRLSELSVLTEAERRRAVLEWNATACDYPRHTAAHRLVEAQVTRAPDAIAVVSANTRLTYGALNDRANQLADHLRAHGLGPEMVVGICLERSPELVVALLGVLKTGAAFLPLDPAYPRERLAFMLHDARVQLLLTQRKLVDHVPQSDAFQVMCIDAEAANMASRSTENFEEATPGPEYLAYVIYTSGSTGRPRGVLVEHRGLCNLMAAQVRDFALGPGSRVLQFAALGFDALVSEVFVTLAAGATLCVAPSEALLPGPGLAELLRRQEITMVTLPPSVLAVIPGDSFPALQTIASAGEPCPARIAARWAAGRRMLNAYGPTEATVCSTVHRIREVDGPVPIGRPIANVQVYIVDGDLQPVPVGVPGELCLGGVGLARGYLGHADLTAERFVPDPFSTQRGARLYRTGDLARYRPDGAIEFLGRLDDQVKIRGFRVEPQEVEVVLGQHPDVQQAVVVAREHGPDDTRLAAYVVPTDGAMPTAEALRRFLKDKLPNHMIPATVVRLEALPLTVNGKIDRRGLAAPEATRRDVDRSYVAPRDVVEFYVARIWEDVFDIGPVGIHDNFFDLGGHSLLAVRLVGHVQRVFDEDLPVSVLFEDPTVEGLACVLRRGSRSRPWSPLVAIQPRGSKRTLFCVHPAGGTPLCYVPLARCLGRDQPLYGLQARGLYGDQEPFTRIEDMAACYVDAVRTLQPKGPYCVGGWSLGGVIAFEMARQLRRAGHAVALLALMDTDVPTAAEHREDEDADGCLASRSEEDRLTHLAELAKTAGVVLPEDGVPEIRRLMRVYRASREALRRYVPGVYESRITLFRAPRRRPEGSGSGIDDPALGWGRLSSEPIEIREVGGDHATMVTEPHVSLLAEQLRVCLERPGTAPAP